MRAGMGILVTFIGGVFWGFSGVAGKYLFESAGVTSDWLVPWRLLTAGSVMLLYLYHKQGKAVFRILKEDCKDLLIYAVFGMMACQYTYFTTVQYSNAAIATILQYSAPPFIMVYMCYRERKKPERIEVISLVSSCIGVFVLCTHFQFETFVISPKALLWGLISAFAMMINTIQPVNLLKKYGSFLPLAWSMIIGGSLLFLWTRPDRIPVHYTWNLFGGFFAVVFLGTIVAFTLYMEGIKMIGPTKAALIACVEPISATVLSILLLGTSFEFFDIVGIALILLAVCLLSYPTKNKKNS
ncbi:DMT family transporter [Fusobacterium necrophorum]|uniref:DMT family transporter n=1 Tax=Fusobacterium necrophorum TaxID=859 RepID=UPI000788F9B7|nr:DMT family transporter [Fusobacterium necrophorum]KYM43906.1 hypothetical protein A2U08_03235 [Fusobacterium necrophorum subsp. funduliforme]